MVGILAQSALSLIAKRQVGYTVAQVATDLRLALLRALLSARWEYFLRQPVGKLTNAVSWEADRASRAYFYGATLLANAIQLVAYAVVGFLVSGSTTAVYLGFAVAGDVERARPGARRAPRREAPDQDPHGAALADGRQPDLREAARRRWRARTWPTA